MRFTNHGGFHCAYVHGIATVFFLPSWCAITNICELQSLLPLFPNMCYRLLCNVIVWPWLVLGLVSFFLRRDLNDTW